MRAYDDPSIERFDIDWSEPGPGPMDGWTTGWFWWRGFGTPAYASVTIGEVGDITFPITCRWQDGYFYKMYYLRYDKVRQAVDLIHKDPDSQEFDLEGDSVEAMDVGFEVDEFSPDILFSQIASILDVAQLTVERTAGNIDPGWANKPDDDEVWIPVDVGQGAVEFATADDLA